MTRMSASSSSAEPARDGVPRSRAPDLTLALLRQGYTFIGRRCRRYGSDAFRTRLMLEDVLCLQGGEAAGFFYGAGIFSRRNAMPVTVLKLLQDRGSVQSLEDGAHRHRKAFFLSLTSGAGVERLCACFAEAWQRHAAAWQGRPRVVLYDDLRPLLTEAACTWLGLAPSGREVAQRSAEMAAMIDGAGRFGPGVLRALWLRRRAERWARDLVLRLRAGSPGSDGGGREEQTPLARLAWHRDPGGALLPAEIAAVELLNLLRPVVAISNYIVFAALALHEHSRWRERFARGEEDDLENFVHEVRRLAPFFPYIGGRAREPFEWRGERFSQGQWVLLDLYGSCRDARLWDAPNDFRPERHRGRGLMAPGLVPQGAAGHADTHRCPGEWIVVALMQEAVRRLSQDSAWRVPPQDLSVDLTRAPARPASGFVMSATS